MRGSGISLSPYVSGKSERRMAALVQGNHGSAVGGLHELTDLIAL